jgi:hypothetical protein
MFLETSAKTAFNVEEAFNLSAQTILSNIEKNKMNLEEKPGMKLQPNFSSKKDGKGGCC